MAFLTEPEPERRVALPVIDGVRRIVADNPSVMTYHGTNTYLIDTGEAAGETVLDPGPDQPDHVAAILAATGGRIARIILSHTHHDHLGATAALKAACGAPTWGFADSADPSFVPDHPLADGDQVIGMTAIHTPGHASDHLCFARPDGVVFSADHVMSWSSSVISPPGGNMADYFRSLRRLLDQPAHLYLPGHGPKLPRPHDFVRDLLRHRQARETAIADALRREPMKTWDLVNTLYSQVDAILRRAAERNVIAHLQKLEEEGRVERRDAVWHAMTPSTAAPGAS